jgi:hypothetical protein
MTARKEWPVTMELPNEIYNDNVILNRA